MFKKAGKKLGLPMMIVYHMMTITEKGGRGVSQLLTITNKGGEVWTPPKNIADIWDQPLIVMGATLYSVKRKLILPN